MTRSSPYRRARRRAAKLRGVTTIDPTISILFGTGAAPTEECETERQKLAERFRRVVEDFQSKNPTLLWNYLNEALEFYNPKADGLSFTMSLVADVQALRLVEHDEFEMQRRKAMQDNRSERDSEQKEEQ